jgi:hypothetical protein
VLHHPGIEDVGGAHAVDARVPGPGVARDPFERHHQDGRVADEVEHIVAPEASVGYRPTGQFGLHHPHQRLGGQRRGPRDRGIRPGVSGR